jgi:branched-chain amino acid transport system substrate-binding protein
MKRHLVRTLAAGAAVTLAACSSSSSSSSPAATTAAAAATTAAPSPSVSTTAPTAPATTAASSPTTSAAPASTAAGSPATTAAPATTAVASLADLGPATGKPMEVGLVNTEGTPGLDFPDIRIDMTAAIDFLNQHGGFGGRPVKLETCVAKGSPETSQACAQELAGKKVELVMLGLDLFPDYKTYTAANIPVIGVLPILPGDYTANALFLTGGNATVMAAAAGVARDHYHAKLVGIVGADNPGANSSEASLTASLDLVGIKHVTVKGGDNETDAGYQGLMREVTKDHPDLLVSLYSDAGCIGTMRGRAALGITTPVITTGICSSSGVLKEVGDDALGWTFIGVSTSEDTPARRIQRAILAPVLKVPEDQVDANGLGLGGLGYLEVMSLADYTAKMQAAGTAVTGPALYDFLKTDPGLTLAGGAPITCGSAPKYPAVCSFIFPFAEYQAGGKVVTVPGLEAFSAKEFLP